MKKYLLILCVAVCGNPAIGQTIYAYPDIKTFRNKTPDTIINARIERRTDKEILRSGGNDYKIASENKALTKKLKQEYWAVEANDSLFVNCRFTAHSQWYALALHRSKEYLYYKAESVNHPNNAVLVGAVAGGALGAAIAGAATAKVNRYDFLTILTSNDTYELTTKSFIWILKSKGDSTLVQQFEHEDPKNIPYGKYLDAISRK